MERKIQINFCYVALVTLFTFILANCSSDITGTGSEQSSVNDFFDDFVSERNYENLTMVLPPADELVENTVITVRFENDLDLPLVGARAFFGAAPAANVTSGEFVYEELDQYTVLPVELEAVDGEPSSVAQADISLADADTYQFFGAVLSSQKRFLAVIPDVIVLSAGGGNGECEKPGPHNTGPISPISELTPITTEEIEALNHEGAVFEKVYIRGTMNAPNRMYNNVTFRDFVWDAQGASFGYDGYYSDKTGIVFENGEMFGASSASIRAGGFIARHLDIHDNGNDGFKPMRSNVEISCNWIHHLGTIPLSHADGTQIRNTVEDILIYRNFFDMPIDVQGHNSNAAVIITNASGTPDRIRVEENWMNGGNYTNYIRGDDDTVYSPPQNVVLKNNRYGRNYRHGLLSTNNVVYCASGNVWDDTDVEVHFNNSSDCN